MTNEENHVIGCPAMPTSEEEWAAHWSELELLRARCASLEAGLREWLASTHRRPPGDPRPGELSAWQLHRLFLPSPAIEHPFAGLRALLDDEGKDRNGERSGEK